MPSGPCHLPGSQPPEDRHLRGQRRISRNRGPTGPGKEGTLLTLLSRLITAVKEVMSLGLGGPDLPRPPRLVYVLLTAMGTILVTVGVLLLRRFFGAEGILILGIIGVSVFWGWVLRWLHADGRITFSHVLVIWLVASGTVMGGTSYYLAYRGITDTLETLSHYVMVETVAGSAGYLVKSTVENTMGRKSNTTGQDI